MPESCCQYDGAHFTAEDIWLDIGANVGVFSVGYANRVHQIVACEPCPEVYLELVSRIRAVGLGNVIPLDLGVVGNDDTQRPFVFSTSDSTLGAFDTLVGTWRGGMKGGSVKTVNINSLILKYGITKIKIDCEGAEYEIVEAANLSGIRELIGEIHTWPTLALLKDRKTSAYTKLLGKIHRIFSMVEIGTNPDSTIDLIHAWR